MCSKMYVGHFAETILVVRQKIYFDDKTFLNNIFEHMGHPYRVLSNSTLKIEARNSNEIGMKERYRRMFDGR